MNDTTIGPGSGPADAGGGETSGNRWEPVPTHEPVLPADSPRGAPTAATRSALGGSRAWLAGGAAAVLVAVLAAGLGGFALGHATAPAGDDAPSSVQQGDHRGFPGHGDGDGDGDHGLPEGGPDGVPPQGQQGQQGAAEGSTT